MSDILTLTMNPAVDLSTSAAEPVEPTHKIRCGPMRRDPGGGGINVARVVTRLGGDCRALFPAGGSPGELLERLVAREGIRELAVPIAGDTRENVTVTEEDSGEQFRFVLPGPELSEAEWRACLEHLSECSPPLYVVASGSLPPGCPPEFEAELKRVVDGLGARLVVDASGPPLAQALQSGVFLVKPSLRELEQVLDRRLPDAAAQHDAAARLVDEGRATAVALTLGEEGALLVTAQGRWRAPRIEVEVVSAVGAGDSFLAGMVWSLAAGDDWQDAFAWAVAAGTAAVLTPGSELAERDEIVSLRSRVDVQPAG